MGKILLVVTILMFSHLAQADSLTITDQNSSLKFTRDDPIYNLGAANDPVQIARTLEWTVDGRQILVYPSGPSTLLDIGHLHPDQHVTAAQMHAQGPLLDFGTGPMTGGVTGSIVYTVDGDPPGSRTSLISEKVDIHNKTSGALSISLTGLGYKPNRAGQTIPDLSGLNITGTTVVYSQGNSMATSLTDGPSFAPMEVLPVVSFSGFNPLVNKSISLPAGGFLTMITELKLSRELPPLVPWKRLWLPAVIVLGMAIGLLAWKQGNRRE
jgi:hypothetical protein